MLIQALCCLKFIIKDLLLWDKGCQFQTAHTNVKSLLPLWELDSKEATGDRVGNVENKEMQEREEIKA